MTMSYRNSSGPTSSASISEETVVDLTDEENSVHVPSSMEKARVLIIDSDDDIVEMELPTCRLRSFKKNGQSVSTKTSTATKKHSSVSVVHEAPKKQKSPKQSPSAEASKRIINCPVCMETIQQFEKDGRQLMVTRCGHIFCEVCIKRAVKAQHRCPSCRKPINWNSFHPLFLS